MGFKEVASLDADTVISLGGKDKKTNKPNPKSIEGFFLGSKKIADRKKKSGFSYIHVFQTPEGNIGVWGKTDMDRKLEAVTPGTMTRCSHTGFRDTPNGEMYTYKVEVDSDNTIEVGELSKQTSTVDTATEDTYEEQDQEEQEEYDSEESDQEVTLAAARASAEKAEKVKGLLNRKNK